jgi:rhodanese-related sulfurtransferase
MSIQRHILHRYVRKTHRYLGVSIGIQFLFWTLGGLYFSWTNIEDIRGENLKKPSDALILNTSFAPIDSVLLDLKNKISLISIEQIELVNLLDVNHYHIKCKTTEGSKHFLVNAVSGKLRSAINADEAAMIAQKSLKINEKVTKIDYITTVDGHHEYREKPLPAYAIRFEGQVNTTIYVAAEIGTVQSFRNNQWRIFDFLWMLHTMDYENRDDINNKLLRLFSILGLITLLSGFILFFITMRKKSTTINSIIIFFLTLFVGEKAAAQNFNNDNKKYATIEWKAFFNVLEKNPNTIFFDIRTFGEQYDTSQYAAANQGFIKGAKHTDFFDFNKFYKSYLPYKDSTIYLYCSHSRRSRILSTRLSDSSFAKVVNINGGMTYLNLIDEKEIPLKKKYYSNNLPYKLINPKAFIKKLKQKNVEIIDIRPDSIYKGIATIEWENSFGKIPAVKHIEADKLEQYLTLNTTKEVVLFDNDGELSSATARQLASKGHQNISVLLHGLDLLVVSQPSKRRKFLDTKYPIIVPDELLQLDPKNTVIVDIRTISEFENRDSIAWKNRGRIKNAINLPEAQLSKEQFAPYKGKKIVLYDLMMHDELYRAAQKLKEYGITNFCLLGGGIFEIHWEKANFKKEVFAKLIE